MIQLLMGIAALLLLFVSYYLLKKQPIFFVLIEETEKNRGYWLTCSWSLLLLLSSVLLSLGKWSNQTVNNSLFVQLVLQ